MPRIKPLWIIITAVVVVLVIGIFVVQHLLDADTYRSRIETTLSKSLGRPVQLGHLSFSLFSGHLVAESPVVADDPAFSNQPFLTAADVRIAVEVAPLIFHHTLHITGFTIEQPKISLLRSENGGWNYSSIGSEGKRQNPTADTNDIIPNLTVKRIDIKGGTVTVGTVPEHGPSHVYSDLNVHVLNFSFAAAFPFTIDGKLPAGGTLNISGNAGPINQHDASLTPLNAQVSLKHADLVASGFVEATQGISGIADLDTKIVSNGQSAQADGKVQVTQIKLAKNGTPSAQPVDVQFSFNQDLQSLSGKIQSANVQIGQAALAISGTYQTRNNVITLQIAVNGQNMPINQLTAFLPSLGIQLPSGSRLQGGTLTANLSVTGPSSAPVISGPVRIADTQLAGFDLGQKLAAIQALTGTKTGSTTTIQTLNTNLQYSSEGTRTDNLVAVVSGLGSATGNGSITPAGALNYRLIVKLNTGGASSIASQAATLLPGLLGGAAGNTFGNTLKNGIPVTITGTTSNPTFTPDMGKVIGGALTHRKGAAANPLGKALGGFFRR